MNEQTNSVIIKFLDDESKFHYLNYYYCKMLDETNDEEYFDKLCCLYQWREQEEPIWRYHENYKSDDDTCQSEYYDSDY